MLRMHRRALLICGGVGAFAVASGLKSDSQMQVSALGKSLEDALYVRSAEALIEHFMSVDFLDLYMAYNCFYPSFMHQRMSALEELHLAINNPSLKIDRNSSRYYALLPCAAAHLLPSFHANSPQREQLEIIISDQLIRAPRCREIVLQNLIATTVPQYDNVLRPPFGASVINAVEIVVRDSLEDRSHVTSLCLSTQFLLNILCMLHPSADIDVKLHIEAILQSILSCNAPHVRSVGAMVSKHRDIFTRPVVNNYLSLSPNSSEILFGIEAMPQKWNEYVGAIAEIHLQMFYEHWRTAYLGEPGMLSADESKLAVLKLIRFWKEKNLLIYLNKSGDENRSIKYFKESLLPELLRNPEGFGVKFDGYENWKDPKSIVYSKDDFPLGQFAFQHKALEEGRRIAFRHGVEDITQTVVGLNAESLLSGVVGSIAGYISARYPLRKWIGMGDANASDDAERAVRVIEETSTRCEDAMLEENERLGPVNLHSGAEKN